MIKTLCFQCRGHGLIPAQGTKIPHAKWPEKKKKVNVNVFKLFFNKVNSVWLF